MRLFYRTYGFSLGHPWIGIYCKNNYLSHLRYQCIHWKKAVPGIK